jgi:hypothetical protein
MISRLDEPSSGLVVIIDGDLFEGLGGRAFDHLAGAGEAGTVAGAVPGQFS